MALLSTLSVVPSSLWLVFTLGVFVLLIVDLSLFKANHGKNPVRFALIESGVWITIALLFNFWFGWHYGRVLGFEFLTGYLVEKSLSVDNLFVIFLIFKSFRIKSELQHKVLFFGVLGAIFFRAFFILVGASLLHHFHWILYIFGGILIVTAIKFLRESDDSEDVTDSSVVRTLKKLIPTTSESTCQSFFIRQGQRWMATPLFLALIVIEITDIIFAVDSIPAVFAITEDAFVAFGSNILAVLGLRALYFVLADWVGKLRYLKPGLATVLGFIGTKMLIVDIYKIPSWISLLVIFMVLLTAGLSSWYVARAEERRQFK